MNRMATTESQMPCKSWLWSSLLLWSSVQMGSVAKCYGPCQLRSHTDPSGVTTEVPTSPQAQARHPLQWLLPGSTSSNSSCGSAIPLKGPSPITPVSPTLTLIWVPGGRGSFSGSPFSCSWPQCWGPRVPNLPRPPAPVTWLGKPPRKQSSNQPRKASLARTPSAHHQPPDFQGC